MALRADAKGGAAHRPAWLRRLSACLDALRHGSLQVLGMPDYERYLAHMAERHPGQAPLSRRQFAAQAIERRYGRTGPRCC